MLDKILDRYFAKKLGEAILEDLRMYDLDIYFIIQEKRIEFYVNYGEENRKFKNDKMIYCISTSLSLEHFFEKRQIVEIVKQRIDKIFK